MTHFARNATNKYKSTYMIFICDFSQINSFVKNKFNDVECTIINFIKNVKIVAIFHWKFFGIKSVFTENILVTYNCRGTLHPALCFSFSYFHSRKVRGTRKEENDVYHRALPKELFHAIHFSWKWQWCIHLYEIRESYICARREEIAHPLCRWYG